MEELERPRIEVTLWPRRPIFRLRDGRQLLLLGIVLFLVVYPLVMITLRSLKVGPLGPPGDFSMKGYIEVFSDPYVYKALQVTLLLAIPRVLLAMALAVGLAWLIARTDLPHKRLVEGLILLTFVLPGLPWIIAWQELASPRGGFLNRALLSHLPIAGLQVNIYSYGGIIVLGAIQIVALLYFFIMPAFRAMDASLEESSRVSGASAWTTFFRIHIPLLAPALLGSAILGLVFTLGSFELEQLLGRRANIYVVTSRIWGYVYGQEPPQWEAAIALSLTFLALTCVLVLIQWRILGKKQYSVITGRGYQGRPHSLGRWRYVLFALVLGFFGFFVLFPFVVMMLNSFTRPTWYGARYTLDNWERAFSTPALPLMLRNTVLLGVGAATVGMALSTLLAYTITQTRWRGRWGLDLLIWMGWALPGLVIGLAYLWAFIFLPSPINIYGTLWVMILAAIARGLPLGTRVLTGTMVQVKPELEESSRSAGASWLQTLRYIWFPLLRPAFLSGWLMLFVFAVRSADIVIFVYGIRSRVLATAIFGGGGGGGSGQVLALMLTFIMVLAFIGITLVMRRHRLA